MRKNPFIKQWARNIGFKKLIPSGNVLMISLFAFAMCLLWAIGYSVAGITVKQIISPAPAKEGSAQPLAEKLDNVQKIPKQTDIKNQEQALDYDSDTIKGWEDTLANLRKIQPSWQKWNKDAGYYKENKDDIQRISAVISQRISNCQKILVSMKAGLQLTDNERRLISANNSLYDEQEALAKRINSNVKAWEPKSDISKKYNSTPDSTVASPTIVVPPPYVKSTSPASSVSQADIEAARIQQEENCESAYTSCVADGIQREESLLRARGMESSAEAQQVASKVTNSCKHQYGCEVYP